MRTLCPHEIHDSLRCQKGRGKGKTTSCMRREARRVGAGCGGCLVPLLRQTQLPPPGSGSPGLLMVSCQSHTTSFTNNTYHTTLKVFVVTKTSLTFYTWTSTTQSDCKITNQTFWKLLTIVLGAGNKIHADI